MRDFTDIAASLRSCKDVDLLLRRHGFRRVEDLDITIRKNPENPGNWRYSSEIWVRRVGAEYQAVRIDWKGHPTDPRGYAGHTPHIHFEMFPVEDFGMYLQGVTRADGTNIPIAKFDVVTGLPSQDPTRTHGSIKTGR